MCWKTCYIQLQRGHRLSCKNIWHVEPILEVFSLLLDIKGVWGPIFSSILLTEVKSKQCIAISELHLTATGNHMPCGITQCYLPPGSGDFPAFTTAEAGTQYILESWMVILEKSHGNWPSRFTLKAR